MTNLLFPPLNTFFDPPNRNPDLQKTHKSALFPPSNVCKRPVERKKYRLQWESERSGQTPQQNPGFMCKRDVWEPLETSSHSHNSKQAVNVDPPRDAGFVCEECERSSAACRIWSADQKKSSLPTCGEGVTEYASTHALNIAISVFSGRRPSQPRELLNEVLIYDRTASCATLLSQPVMCYFRCFQLLFDNFIQQLSTLRAFKYQ